MLQPANVASGDADVPASTSAGGTACCAYRCMGGLAKVHRAQTCLAVFEKVDPVGITHGAQNGSGNKLGWLAFGFL